jgi:formylglycine-generating enzyme required for sulfatase activity
MVELETFVQRHGSSPEAEYARARIDNLKRQLAKAAPQKASPPAPTPSMPVAPAAAAPPTRPVNAECEGIELSVANAKRCLKPKESFKDCPQCPEMVVVPAGSFTMGSSDATSDEKPPHPVTIAKPFAVAKYEATFAEWEACVAEKACREVDDEGWGRGRRPAINVAWREAREYAAWLTTKTGRTYRLLSEAEWEYAARAGTSTRYAFGDGLLQSQAQYSERRQSRVWKTVEVGSFQANGFGLHDMHGNVSEWVADSFHPDYDGAPRDGSIWDGGNPSASIIRGGSWNDDADALRSAYRGRSRTVGSSPFVGFRVARTLGP